MAARCLKLALRTGLVPFRGLLPILGAVALHGCSGAADGRLPHDLHDAPERTLVEVFRLGGLEPPEAEMFDALPLIVMAVDRDERLFVLHRRQGRVAVFEANGTFVRWIGHGAGRGPGEFNTPDRIGLLGDTVRIRNMSPPTSRSSMAAAS